MIRMPNDVSTIRPLGVLMVKELKQCTLAS